MSLPGPDGPDGGGPGPGCSSPQPAGVLPGERPRLSVIVSTFDRPDALRLVLEGYARSAYGDFEVIVADDGSRQETGQMLDAVARGLPFPLSRVWQPHCGFRLAAARNLAARSARGEILVFTDGDCVPFGDTLAHHALRCAPGRAQTGARCLLSPDETSRLLAGQERPPELEARARRREGPRLRRLWRRNLLYAVTGWKVRPKLLTANAAVHREDFERVNGFDERFVGWGYEDEDLARRLRRLGVRVLDASRECLVLHLFHPVHESHRPDARGGENYRYFRKGTFLTRPLAGLHPRRVEELAVELLGDLPPELLGVATPATVPTVPTAATAATAARPAALATLPALSTAGRAVSAVPARGGPGVPPEVSVVFGRGCRLTGPRPGGEVVLRLAAGSRVASRESLYQLLRETL